jgi:hypothetical protein
LLDQKRKKKNQGKTKLPARSSESQEIHEKGGIKKTLEPLQGLLTKGKSHVGLNCNTKGLLNPKRKRFSGFLRDLKFTLLRPAVPTVA